MTVVKATIHGAISIVNAIATGKGAALGISKKVNVEMETAHGNGIEIEIQNKPMKSRLINKVIQKIEKEFKDNLNFKLETDIRNTESFFLCDCMISDWSGVAIEYAFAFEKPILYVDTPQKINNPECDQINLVPLEEKIRSQIGEVISLSELSLIPSKINQFLQSQNKFKEKIQKNKEETVFNVGNSGEQGAKYLLELKKSLES